MDALCVVLVNYVAPKLEETWVDWVFSRNWGEGLEIFNRFCEWLSMAEMISMVCSTKNKKGPRHFLMGNKYAACARKRFHPCLSRTKKLKDCRSVYVIRQFVDKLMMRMPKTADWKIHMWGRSGDYGFMVRRGLCHLEQTRTQFCLSNFVDDRFVIQLSRDLYEFNNEECLCYTGRRVAQIIRTTFVELGWLFARHCLQNQPHVSTFTQSELDELEVLEILHDFWLTYFRILMRNHDPQSVYNHVCYILGLVFKLTGKKIVDIY